MKGFMDFIRKQGVVGLAVGFLLGGAVSKVVTALVTDIVNPILSIVLGITDGLKEAKLEVGSTLILWGDFAAGLIDLLVIAAVVDDGVQLLGIEMPDKKSDKKK